jgi:hypothetical protein
MADLRLHAAFATSAEVRLALNRLGQDGVAPAAVEIRSSVPLEHDIVPVGGKIKSRLPWTSVVGGLVGGTAFFMLVKLTSEAYALPTGGMPIVPMPTTGVITFEGLAIGAIIATVATMLYESRLPALLAKPGPLDHHIASDHILVTVKCDEGASTAWTANALETARD